MTEFKCEACGATAGKNGKPFTRGSLNLHQAMHCKASKGGGSSGGCCANPSVRLLTADESTAIRQAGHKGYTKICETCLEVS